MTPVYRNRCWFTLATRWDSHLGVNLAKDDNGYIAVRDLIYGTPATGDQPSWYAFLHQISIVSHEPNKVISLQLKSQPQPPPIRDPTLLKQELENGCYFA